MCGLVSSYFSSSSIKRNEISPIVNMAKADPGGEVGLSTCNSGPDIRKQIIGVPDEFIETESPKLLGVKASYHLNSFMKRPLKSNQKHNFNTPPTKYCKKALKSMKHQRIQCDQCGSCCPPLTTFNTTLLRFMKVREHQ